MLIPLGDVIPCRIRPWGTSALIVLMAAAFATDRVAILASPGWVTFTANILAVWIFGQTVEGRMGHVRFALFAAGGAVLGWQCPQWFGYPVLDPPMGASAAAGAIVAGYFVLTPGSRVLVLAWLITAVDVLEVPAFFFAGLWALAQAFHAMSPFIDTTAVLLTCAAGATWGLGAIWLLRRPVDWGNTPRKGLPKA